VHAAYARAGEDFLVHPAFVDAVFHQFRAGFIGQVRPGAFLLGKFSTGGDAFFRPDGPERPAPTASRAKLSHEVSSVGSGGHGRYEGPAFYSYAAPEPRIKEARVRPDAARYDATLGGIPVDYDAVRNAESPSTELFAFCQSTYDAAAELGKWDRQLLERMARINEAGSLFEHDSTLYAINSRHTLRSFCSYAPLRIQ